MLLKPQKRQPKKARGKSWRILVSRFSPKATRDLLAHSVAKQYAIKADNLYTNIYPYYNPNTLLLQKSLLQKPFGPCLNYLTTAGGIAISCMKKF